MNKQLTIKRKRDRIIKPFGGIAQLVERLNGIQEVSGSNPLISTTKCTAMRCFFRGGDKQRIVRTRGALIIIKHTP